MMLLQLCITHLRLTMHSQITNTSSQIPLISYIILHSMKFVKSNIHSLLMKITNRGKKQDLQNEVRFWQIICLIGLSQIIRN